MKYFLDTNICIYFLKGKYPALLQKIMLHSPEDIKIPSIVKAELLYGAEKSQKMDENIINVNNFLLPFEIVPFDNASAEVYSIIRCNLEKKAVIIGPNDMIIASTVLSKRGCLVSNNEKEFSRISDLIIENWTI